MVADKAGSPVGGLGLHMVRTMTSSMIYSRGGGINRLTLTIPDLSSQKSDTPASPDKVDPG